MIRRILYPGLLALAAVLAAAQGAEAAPAILYAVSLTDPAAHLIQVRINLPAGMAEHDLQLPVWNALYQVRDFSQYVQWVRATAPAGQPLEVHKLDKSRWRVSGAENGAAISYQILADLPGPYGAQLTPQHAFLNLAETLMYPVDSRASPCK